MGGREIDAAGASRSKHAGAGQGERGQTGRGADQADGGSRRAFWKSAEVGQGDPGQREPGAREHETGEADATRLADGARTDRGRRENEEAGDRRYGRDLRPKSPNPGRPGAGSVNPEFTRAASGANGDGIFGIATPAPTAAISSAPPPHAASLHTRPLKPPGTIESASVEHDERLREPTVGADRADERVRGEFESRDRGEQPGCGKGQREDDPRQRLRKSRREQVRGGACLGAAKSRRHEQRGACQSEDDAAPGKRRHAARRRGHRHHEPRGGRREGQAAVERRRRAPRRQKIEQVGRTGQNPDDAHSQECEKRSERLDEPVRRADALEHDDEAHPQQERRRGENRKSVSAFVLGGGSAGHGGIRLDADRRGLLGSGAPS